MQDWGKQKRFIFWRSFEADGMTLMKWKHLGKEKGKSIKGKVPKWFKQIEQEVIQDPVSDIRKIKNKYIDTSAKRMIHTNYFDENIKEKKNEVVTWNDSTGLPVFAQDEKQSKSRNFKRIGIHLIIKEGVVEMNNSPELKKCEGCIRNISKKKDAKECLIYLEGDNSRTIEKRNEKEYIKPYETLNNIMIKNDWIKNYNEELEKDNLFNGKIEIIYTLIKAEEKDFIDILKNSIIER